MLILNRKKDDGILITTMHGEQIRVCICDISGSRVRVGIDAPRDITVLREELLREELLQGKEK